MTRLFVTGTLALFLASGVTQKTAAKEDEAVTISGCVQGFTQGGYFLSDAIGKNGKPKHYLLVNDNDEIKEHTGKLVEVIGRPAEFSWGVKIQTADNRTLKTSSVFGVDEVRVISNSCTDTANQVASR